jgi:hypothetical protein
VPDIAETETAAVPREQHSLKAEQTPKHIVMHERKDHLGFSSEQD